MGKGGGEGKGEEGGRGGERDVDERGEEWKGRGVEGEGRGKGREGEGRERGLCSSNISLKKALVSRYEICHSHINQQIGIILKL